MSSRVPGTYLWEIARQARMARWAWERLQQLHATAEDPPFTAEKLQWGDKMHAEVQAILTAASQISKMLSADFEEDWPEARITFTRERAKAVQRIIRKPKPIIMTRKLRNAVEHFDARLDDALFATPEIGLLDTGVGPTPPLTSEGTLPLRSLDTSGMVFYVLGDSISLRELMAEVERVGQRARDWIDVNGGGWYEGP